MNSSREQSDSNLEPVNVVLPLENIAYKKERKQVSYSCALEYVTDDV